MIYHIHSTAGADHGTWEGSTPAEALLAMHRDAGIPESDVWIEDGEMHFRGDEIRERCGDVDDWVIEEIPAESVIYYRRLAETPVTDPSDVEVTAEEQVTGTSDGAWHAARSDDRLAESLGLCDRTDCVLLADAMVIYRACLDSGLCSDRWAPGDWTPYTYAQLDIGHPEDVVLMYRALALLSPEDARQQVEEILRTCPDDDYGLQVRMALRELQ